MVIYSNVIIIRNLLQIRLSSKIINSNFILNIRTDSVTPLTTETSYNTILTLDYGDMQMEMPLHFLHLYSAIRSII